MVGRRSQCPAVRRTASGGRFTCAIALGEGSCQLISSALVRAHPHIITRRGRDLIAACPVCIYAGSWLPKALRTCPPWEPASWIVRSGARRHHRGENRPSLCTKAQRRGTDEYSGDPVDMECARRAAASARRSWECLHHFARRASLCRPRRCVADGSDPSEVAKGGR